MTPSVSPSVTFSPSVSPTPIPLPFHLILGVYNQAGERVRLLFDGASAVLPGGYQLSAGTLVPGHGEVLVLGVGGESLGLPAFNGSNDQSQWLSNGIYHIKVESRDSFGTVSASVLPVQVMSAPSNRVSALEVFNSAGERVALLALQGPAERGSLALIDTVLVPGRSPLKVEGRNAFGVLETTLWDGRDAHGAAVQSGTYYLKAGDFQWSFTVLAAPAETLRAPRLLSNPIPAGAASIRVQAPNSDAPWTVAFFDLSGARVAEQSMAAGQDASIAVGHLSAGIYLGIAHGLDARGQRQRWSLKAALLR